MAAQGLDLAAPRGAFAARAPVARAGGAIRGRVRVVHLVALSLVFVALGQLGRIPLVEAGLKEAPLLVTDLVVLLAVAGAAGVAVRERILRLDRVALAGLLFAGVGGLSALLAVPRFGLDAFELGFSLAYLVRWLVYFGLYVAVINFLTRDDVGPVLRVLETTVLVFALFGIVQSIFLPNFAFVVHPEAVPYLDWDPQGHRLVSTFLDPNFAGALLTVVLLIHGARYAFGAPVEGWRTLIFAVALVLTFSRSSALALIVGGAVILAVRGPTWRAAAVAAVTLFLLVPLAPYLVALAAEYNKLVLNDPSAMTRLVGWAHALQVFIEHPWIGVGFNTYGFVQLDYGFMGLHQAAFGVEGGLLFIAVMTGLVGLALFGLLLALAVAHCVEAWKDMDLSTEHRALALGTAAATAALVIHSLFVNSILYPFLMQVLWVLWGLVAVVRRDEEARDAL